MKKHDNEEVVEEDAFKIPVLETNIKLGHSGRDWNTCVECGNFVLNECNGKTYYHKLSCSLSNGIRYNEERVNTTLPHHERCDCYTCSPPKAKEKK